MPNKRIIPRVCEACGADFLALRQAVKNGYARFCSRACWRASFGPFVTRFWAKVNKNGPTVRPDLGPCWVWTASSLNAFGYGVIGLSDGGTSVAHRVSYEMAHAVTLAREQKVLHHCDNPPCVRPDHLFLGTQADNIADMMSKGRHWSQKRTVLNGPS